MIKQPCVYILASQKNGTLYIGVTSDLLKRVYKHKNDMQGTFTKKYNVKMLVYYEMYDDMAEAIKREKVLKGWRRERKIALIEKNNREWIDLYDSLF
ncbi:MAG: GIY-YIG nuclease family protein [Alphaproteobacteria bacterium]|nr:GIY-YIG nuclease family protein [Alphaproteobacteria bacterium]